MIINDIILENRALNPDELNIINVLKSKGSNAGDMFSEVGPFLTVNQFKCLARWVIAANMATVVKRRNESETFENDYLLLEFEVLFGRTNFTTLNEGKGFEALRGLFAMFGKSLDEVLKPIIKKVNPKAVVDDAVTKVEVPDELIKPLAQLDSAGKPMIKPNPKSVGHGTEDLVKMQAKLEKEVAEKLGKELPEELAGSSKAIAKEGTESFMYKSGIKFDQFVHLIKTAPGRLARFIASSTMSTIKNVSLGLAVTTDKEAAVKVARQIKAAERVFSSRRTTPTVQKACDADAHVIRNILHKHGWIMTSTPTGY